jgi:hypothetical protein
VNPPILSNIVRGVCLVFAGFVGALQAHGLAGAAAALGYAAVGAVLVAWELYGGSLADLRRDAVVRRRARRRQKRVAAHREARRAGRS